MSLFVKAILMLALITAATGPSHAFDLKTHLHQQTAGRD